MTHPDDRRSVPGQGTLLGVWAHPDDEAYLSAGLMARTRDAGGRVVVVTATAGEPCDLLYATVTPGFHARWGQVNEQIGVWESEPPCTPDDDLALTVDCAPVLDRKMAALEAHASQVRPLVELLGRARFREWWATEWFAAAARAAGPDRARALAAGGSDAGA